MQPAIRSRPSPFPGLRLLLVISFSATLALPGRAAAAEEGEAAARNSNDDCLGCHGERDMTRADGTPVFVDRAKWESSIHNDVSIECVDCHADVATADLPHEDRLKPATCLPCHKKEVAGYQAGIHSRPRPDGKGIAAKCTSCHGPAHEILASGDRRAPTYVLNVVTTCARCHANRKVIEAVGLPKTVVTDFQESIHGRALTQDGLIVAPTCSTCHGAHEIREPKDPKSRVSKLNLPKTCGGCHVTIVEKYEESIHAKQVKKGNKKAPNCETCHSAHRIQRIAGATWELDVIKECGTCHKESLTTYRDTFHGRVTELGYTRVAKCADCHRPHDIVARTDPSSPVNPANLVTTCRHCHPKATKGFTQYDPHANPENRKRSVVLYYTGWFMKLLLISVFAFFWLHTALWVWRGLIDRRRNKRKA